MARADLFVLSSLTEGMPNVIGEAMALGLPVVATDCSPGVREYLDDGRAGLLVPPGDPRALARGIEQLLSDAPLRRELARRGRERIVQFDLSATVRAYESLLEHLL
jgi:glycosyltransferase involved in cell wall biosynthesis